MDWYFYVALAAIISQLVFSLQIYNNYRYALNKYKRKRWWYRPRTVLIIPCKGLDANFHKNIASFFDQDYNNYLLWFVVAEESDPAYAELCKLKEQHGGNSQAHDIRIFVSGKGQSCSQKIHNLLYCYRQIDEDVDVLAFADSDICVKDNWLNHLVYPLRQSKNGAASGYRWFVPTNNNLASLAQSVINAKVAQLLGNTIFNQAWGGSMAIRVDVFRKIGLDKIWTGALSDDLSLSVAVKKARLKVAFVPACLVASYESTTWRGLFEFGRRQFVITRVCAPKTWWFGFCGSLYSVLGIWAAAGLAVYAAAIDDRNFPLFAAVPVVFCAGQLIRSILRQKMAGKLLENERKAMKNAFIADVLGFWFWSFVLLLLTVSSAFGRTICWRGVRYRLISPSRTIIEPPPHQPQ